MRMIGTMLVAFVLTMAAGFGYAADAVVVFRNDLTPSERLIVRRLPDMRGDRPELEEAFRRGEVWIADAKLRVDGSTQKIVVLQIGYFCGSAGCTTLILNRVGRRWVEISSVSFEVNAPAPLRILPESDEGWYRVGWGDETYTWRMCSYWDSETLLEEDFDPKNWCRPRPE